MSNADLTCQDGDIELVNGNSFTGRVEICHNETCGTICGRGWSSQSANVTCRQLGFTGYYNCNINTHKGGKESVLLCTALREHCLKSIEVNLCNTAHKIMIYQ